MSTQSHHLSFPIDYEPSVRANRRGQRTECTRGVFWLAMLTTLATFPLIFMGGLVTSHHAGMSVPDWPNSYHYNMFLFPPSHWVGGILYEHTHRLMGTVVGMLAIALVIWSWRAQVLAPIARTLIPPLANWRPPVERHRMLAIAVLVAVIAQGVLGGLRVVLVNLDLAIVHACVAQAFFCLAAFTALVNSQWWQHAPIGVQRGKTMVGQTFLSAIESESAGQSCPPEPTRIRSEGQEHPAIADSGRQECLPHLVPTTNVVKLGVITVAVIYLQLIVGATMRHFDAGLAIPDLPLAYGKLLPPTTAGGLAAINHLRAFQLDLDPVTLSQLWLHFAHRIGAVLVTALVIAFATMSLLRAQARGLAIPSILLLILLAAQVTLGVLTVLLRKPADIASSHVAVGALVLVTAFILTAKAARISSDRRTGRFSDVTRGKPPKKSRLSLESFRSPLLVLRERVRVRALPVIPEMGPQPAALPEYQERVKEADRAGAGFFKAPN